MNEELRAITKNQRGLDSAVMMSSLIPSEKYPCSGSPLTLVKGSTAIAGRSGRGNTAGADSWVPSDGGSAAWAGSALSPSVRTTAMKRRPLARAGPDQLLAPATVTDRRLCRIDAACQCCVRHDPTAADRGDKIVLADDAIAILHQVDQKVEDLRFDMDRAPCVPQFASFKIDLAVAIPGQLGDGPCPPPTK